MASRLMQHKSAGAVGACQKVGCVHETGASCAACKASTPALPQCHCNSIPHSRLLTGQMWMPYVQSVARHLFVPHQSNLGATQRDHTDIGDAVIYRTVQEDTSPEQQ